MSDTRSTLRESDREKVPRLRRLARAIESLPFGLRVVLLFAAILHGVGLSWGMPASDAWDNDGIAPRDILPGLAETFTPGHYATYPPAHFVLLAVLTLPVTLAAVVKAGGTSIPLVMREILAPAYMTPITMTARVVSLLMSVGAVLGIAKIAEEIASNDAARAQRVSIFAALVASVGLPFTYYAHVSNVDVPYLFWGVLAAHQVVCAVARSEPQRLRRAAVFAALSVATKDQAYAIFVLSVPAAIAAWLVFDRGARERTRAIGRESVLSAALFASLVLFLDGALVNPSGFRARIAFLSGAASQDFAMYSSDLRGRLENLVDVARELRTHYPTGLAIFFAMGLVLAVRGARGERRRLVIALFPFAAMLSFTLAFNLVARRMEERFTLPQMLFVAVYGGFGFERVWSGLEGKTMRQLGRIAAAVPLAAAVWNAVRVDLTLLYEPRYDAEKFLAQTAVGSTVEVHGMNVYLPRFPSGVRVIRVDPKPPEKRGPMPGVEEVQAPLSEIAERNPRFVLVSGCYVWRFLERSELEGGRVYPQYQMRAASDPDATRFFRGLFAHKLGYRLVLATFIPTDFWFRLVDMHASLACPMFIFERTQG